MSTINTYSDIDRRDSLEAKFQEIDNTIYVTEVSLTAANIIAMNATPVEVIAAPGAGKVIEVIGATFILDKGATAFTGGGVIQIIEEAGGNPVLADIAASYITNGSDVMAAVPQVAATYGLVDNSAIQITNDTAAFANGNGVVRLKIAYRVHNTGL